MSAVGVRVVVDGVASRVKGVEVMFVMLLVVLLASVVVAVVRRRGRRMRRLSSPLAGLDTGCRFSRTPGRYFKPHRGF